MFTGRRTIGPTTTACSDAMPMLGLGLALPKLASIFHAAATGSFPSSVSLQSDDTLWYPLAAYEITFGVATLDPGQTPVAAGTTAYLVLLNTTDGLKYKLKLQTISGVVDYAIDPTPTVEAETPTTLTVNGRNYKITLITNASGDVTFDLVQV